jgi:hypothetical protein
MADAEFSDGAERPVNLGAFDTDDLRIISALAQDAVFPATEIKWLRRERKLALLVNRFRWEDVDQAKSQRRPVERVQSLLVINQVSAVASQGIDPRDRDLVLSVLSLDFDGPDDGAGHVVITLAGDGAVRASVDALDVMLRDVTRPYVAPSGNVPQHKV